MIDDAMPLHFDIINSGNADAADDPVVFEHELVVVPAGKEDGRLIDDAAERLIGDGLDDKIHRRNRIPVYGILHHIRDKNEDDGAVYFAQLVRTGQPVHARHLDI